MTRTVRELLAEPIAHLDAIHRHMAQSDFEDEVITDAVALRLSAMIETLRRGDPDLTTDLFGEVWPEIWGVRNRIAHGYAWIDLGIVRATIEGDLPSVERTLRAVLDQSP